MLEAMTEEEVLYWKAYYGEEGYPDDNLRLWFGQVISSLKNINSGKHLAIKKALVPADVVHVPWRDENTGLSLEQQRLNALEFRARYKQVYGE